MTNAEKNALIVDCVKKAVEEIYPDAKGPDRNTVETMFYAYLQDAGLAGLFGTMIKVFNKTLEGAGLVTSDYWDIPEELPNAFTLSKQDPVPTELGSISE